jgi:hypothetical protein
MNEKAAQENHESHRDGHHQRDRQDDQQESDALYRVHRCIEVYVSSCAGRNGSSTFRFGRSTAKCAESVSRKQYGHVGQMPSPIRACRNRSEGCSQVSKSTATNIDPDLKADENSGRWGRMISAFRQ